MYFGNERINYYKALAAMHDKDKVIHKERSYENEPFFKKERLGLFLRERFNQLLKFDFENKKAK